MDRRHFLGRSLSFGTAALLSSSVTAARAASEPLRVAVIGHTGRGDYGHGLDTVWNRIEEASIVAVADAHGKGLEKALQQLGLSEASGFADYREMLTRVRPDLVAVCPRHVDQHADMILAAIRSGAKGIYVEKPFVRTPREADEVLAACETHGAKVAVAHRNAYHPTIKVVTDLMDRGRIGRVLEIRGRGKGDRRGGGEDLWVLGSHILNLFTILAGKPASCSAVLLQDGKRVTDQQVREGAEGLGPLAGNQLHARFLFDDGVVGFFDSVANDETENEGFGLHVIGSQGRIAIQADLDPLAYLIPGNPFRPNSHPTRWLPITSGGVDVKEPDPDRIWKVQHHDVAAADLIRAVTEDREPRCSAADAAWTIEMIHAVFASHRAGGKEVTFPLPQRDHALLGGQTLP